MAGTVRIDCPSNASALVQKAAAIFKARITERTGIRTATTGPAEARITLAIDSGIGREGFRIADGPNGSIEVAGNDDRGVLYGVGKLLRAARLDAGQFAPGPWRGTSVPRRSVRGIYFASHFHNFYHEAPIERVERYVEDLALWGCNALSVWYDMHHYRGIDDPAAQAMIARLKAILRAANGVGIGAGLTTLANEAYAGSPEHLRAIPFPWHYHVELCPSKPEGLALVLKWREEMLRAFADVRVEYLWVWPYDQGGCKCDACAPWGANGFLRNGEAVARLVRRVMPNTKIVLSTWCFDYWDKREWPGLAKVFERRPDWVDYLMADSHGEFPRYPLEQGVPGGLPMLNFPEISMFNNSPWGGYGAIPAPARFQGIWNTVGDRLAGGFPYSEGIYEDINKTISLQHYWGDQDALATVREYAAAEFAPDVAEEVVAVVQRLEQVQAHSLTAAAGKPNEWGGKTPPLHELKAAKEKGLTFVQETLDRLLAAECKLSQPARDGWRWRILRCRATLDVELIRSGGLPTAGSEACFEELTRIYATENPEWAVTPPSFRKLSGGKIPRSW